MPKRGNGTGSIQQRAGRFVAVYSLPVDRQGKRRRISARFGTHPQAEEWLRLQTTPLLQPDVSGAADELVPSMTYGSFLQQWLELRKPHVREKTWLEYQRLIRKYLEPSAIIQMPIHLLAPLHVERLVLQWLTDGATRTQAFLITAQVRLAPVQPRRRSSSPRHLKSGGNRDKATP
ncbi:hypothetical protein LAJ19_16610 (plasmid) [Deinococcus taeanensis]|uniref:hypothetical protein n=1 Tax=Deinococcus taeanensis TaxID=2737050 RepID=UPI001CDC865B|nr:hypothetical protein [Deinococcus taeanensis]UBV44771.1 hypothetical protein LAJ19_16610 [Deinococcus taeanensis]